MSEPRDRAVYLLDHYITLVMERPGTRKLTTTADTHTELAELVDAIIEASVQAVRTNYAAASELDERQEI
jgi:hypothetical protein